VLESPLHGRRELVRSEGLRDVVEGPQLEGRNCRLDRGVTRDNDYGRLLPLLSDPFEDLDAVKLRHLQVEEDEVCAFFPYPVQGLAGARERPDLIAFFVERLDAAPANVLLVVDDEYLSVRHERSGRSQVQAIPRAA